jgi:hypothetical protein
MLDKKGNSNHIERKELLEEFREIFADVKVEYITADREFIGEKWFEDLLNQTMMEWH